MSAPALEAFLVRLYVEPETRARFLADPAGEAIGAGLGAEEAAALGRIDRAGLEMAAESFAAKRRAATARPSGASWVRAWARALRRALAPLRRA